MSLTADRLLDITGVAERLGVGERFVRRLVSERRIPFVKVGRTSASTPASLVSSQT